MLTPENAKRVAMLYLACCRRENEAKDKRVSLGLLLRDYLTATGQNSIRVGQREITVAEGRPAKMITMPAEGKTLRTRMIC